MELHYQRVLFEELCAEDALAVLAPGLGLRFLLARLLRRYCDPAHFVVVVNATAEEEDFLVSQLALDDVSPLPAVVNNEVPVADRVAVYASGGVVFVTSRIMVVDILSHRFPTSSITGIIVCHAERVTEYSAEALILRQYRQATRTGFVKALSEEPQDLTGGFGKLEKTLRALYLTKVHLWPRFHADVQATIDRVPMEVDELAVPLTDEMRAIQGALLELIDSCLFDLRRANPTVDVSEFTVENAIYRSFDGIVRQQLDPIWHRVSVRSKQLIGDIKTLRKLLTYLCTYDCVTFLNMVDTILAGFHAMGDHATWVLSDAANVLVRAAQARVYRKKAGTEGQRLTAASVEPVLEENPKFLTLAEVLREIQQAQAAEGRKGKDDDDDDDKEGGAMAGDGAGPAAASSPILVIVEEDRTCQQLRDYLAMGGQAYLQQRLKAYFRWKETLPRLTANIAQARAGPAAPAAAGSGGSGFGRGGAGTGRGGGSAGPGGPPQRRRRGALIAAARLGGSSAAAGAAVSSGAAVARPSVLSAESEALADFLAWFPEENKRQRATFTARVLQAAAQTAAAVAEPDADGPSAKRARGTGADGDAGTSPPADDMDEDADDVPATAASASSASASASAYSVDPQVEARLASDDSDASDSDDDGPRRGARGPPSSSAVPADGPDGVDDFDAKAFDAHFGLLSGPHVVIHPHSQTRHTRILYELQPQYIVLYDVDLAFLREVEVYRAQNQDRPVHVYVLMYDQSIDEQRYVMSVARERNAFERLIKERANMSVRRDQDGRSGQPTEADMALVSTRRGGGRVVAPKQIKVVVDMREFRSSLPILLDEIGVIVVPVTLEVGDYILAPEICVERKSIADLVSSLASGRLYTQAEAMCTHYQFPVLLIEFEATKAFALQSTGDLKDDISSMAISSKLVLLSLHFPKLKIIWSQSPHQTAEIFQDLKRTFAEPDEAAAASIGVDTSVAAAVYNAMPQEVVQHLPGVSARNLHRIMRNVRSLNALASMSEAALAAVMEAKPARELHQFLHRDSRA